VADLALADHLPPLTLRGPRAPGYRIHDGDDRATQVAMFRSRLP
jgi:hypothetical protein